MNITLEVPVEFNPDSREFKLVDIYMPPSMFPTALRGPMEKYLEDNPFLPIPKKGQLITAMLRSGEEVTFRVTHVNDYDWSDYATIESKSIVYFLGGGIQDGHDIMSWVEVAGAGDTFITGEPAPVNGVYENESSRHYLEKGDILYGNTKLIWIDHGAPSS